MGVTIFISLYTTRLILSALGKSDFGIFNVVGGAIAMLGFLNSTMANATQRFMSFARGKGDIDSERRIFNVSLVLHFTIAAVTALLLAAAIYPLFNGILNIPPDRTAAAKTVYLSLIFSTVLTIMNVPYDAVMNAHENMLYYSLIGIFESLLKLAVAFVCVHTSSDKLIVYGALTALIPLITLSIMKIYCHRHYDECVVSPLKYWDTGIVRHIAAFSGWNFLTAVSSLFTVHGVSLVLNHFFGTLLNTAHGVATQLNGQLSALSVNLMKALNPVIVKNAGAGNIGAMNRAALEGCKFSTYIIMLPAVPFVIEMPYIMQLWLKAVPEWASVFCVLQIVQTLICQMAQGAATAVYARGDIKHYAIYKSIVNAMPVVLTYICFRMGGGPFWLYVPMIAVWAVGGDVVIIKFAKEKCGLDVERYIKEVVLPSAGVACVMLLSGYAAVSFMQPGFARLVVCCIATTAGMLASLCLFGVSADEKKRFKDILSSFAKR